MTQSLYSAMLAKTSIKSCDLIDCYRKKDVVDDKSDI